MISFKAVLAAKCGALAVAAGLGVAAATIGFDAVERRFSPKVGWIEELEIDGPAVRVSGWAWDPDARHSPAGIVLVIEERIRSTSSTTVSRRDVATALGAPASIPPLGFDIRFTHTRPLTPGQVGVRMLYNDGRSVALRPLDKRIALAGDPAPPWWRFPAGMAVFLFVFAPLSLAVLSFGAAAIVPAAGPDSGPSAAPGAAVWLRFKAAAGALMRSRKARAIAGIAGIGSFLAAEAYLRDRADALVRERHVSALVETIRGAANDSLAIDLDVGFRYRPFLSKASFDVYMTQWRTNSHGHVADQEYTVAKPPNEVRIAVVGDEVAAGTGSVVRWPALLSDLLAAAPEWRAAYGERAPRVINFAREGLGARAAELVVRREAMRYAPDIVLVSLPVDALARPLAVRGGSGAIAAEDMRTRVERAYDLAAQTDAVRLSDALLPRGWLAALGVWREPPTPPVSRLLAAEGGPADPGDSCRPPRCRVVGLQAPLAGDESRAELPRWLARVTRGELAARAGGGQAGTLFHPATGAPTDTYQRAFAAVAAERVLAAIRK